MANTKKTLRRADLERRLRDQGFSRREATRAVNAVLEVMRDGLVNDHEVQFPLGKLKIVFHRHRQQEGVFLGEKRTIYRRRWTVVHELDSQGKRVLNPPPPKPTITRSVLPPRLGEKREDKQIPMGITATPKHPIMPSTGTLAAEKKIAVNRPLQTDALARNLANPLEQPRPHPGRTVLPANPVSLKTAAPPQPRPAGGNPNPIQLMKRTPLVLPAKPGPSKPQSPTPPPPVVRNLDPQPLRKLPPLVLPPKPSR